jgi:pantothenate kinase
MTSTVEATFSTKFDNSSYIDSDEGQSKYSDIEDSITSYIKVKTNAQKKCLEEINNISQELSKICKTSVEIKLLEEGSYKGYFIIVSDSKVAIDLVKQKLLTIEDLLNPEII